MIALFFRCLMLIGLITISIPSYAFNDRDLLPAEKAFSIHLSSTPSPVIQLDIADGYYVYKNRVYLKNPQGQIVSTPKLKFPQGQIKQDPFFGKQEIYHGQVLIPILANTGLTTAELKQYSLQLQGCAEAGVCYPPLTQSLNTKASFQAIASWIPKPTAGNLAVENTVNWIDLALFYLAGLGMALTACMYPLLPIVSAMISGQGHHLTRQKGVWLTLAYTQGLALSYTLIGIIAALSGTLLTVWLQQPVVVLSGAALMVLLAFSMFGWFQIQLPSSLQSRMNDSASKFKGGHFFGAFAMGAVSALIIGPCVAPPLIAILGYIGQTADWVLGGVSLYVLALGIGTPLLLIGLLGSHFLPKTGVWTNSIKFLFGWIMLGVAIWIAKPFLPPIYLEWILVILSFALAVYCLIPSKANSYLIIKLVKITSFLVALTFCSLQSLLLVSDSPILHPLKSTFYEWVYQKQTKPNQIQFIKVHSLAELDQALAKNDRSKPILIDVYADWCVSCLEMEEKTYNAPSVAPDLNDFYLIKVDVTQASSESTALLTYFKLFGPPSTIILDSSGQELSRQSGFIDAPIFVNWIKKYSQK